MVSPSSHRRYNSGCSLMSTWESKPRRMICQIKPRIRCSVPVAISDEPMLTTEQPIALAEVMTMLLFSVIWNAFKGLRDVGLFRTRISMVSGTESLISLHRIKPSRASSKSCIVSVGIGMREPTSGSPSIICERHHRHRTNAFSRIRTSCAHPVDVVRELSPLILVNGMADVCIGALHGDLASPGGHGRCLRAKLNIELSDVDCMSRER
jgi:hypothetical protein